MWTVGIHIVSLLEIWVICNFGFCKGCFCSEGSVFLGLPAEIVVGIREEFKVGLELAWPGLPSH